MMAETVNIHSHPARDALIEEVTERVIATSGGGGHIGGMEARVTRLEAEFEHVRKDLDEIKVDLKGVAARLNELPTKQDINSNLQWIVGASVAVVALFVAVLAYLQDQRIATNQQSTPSPAPVIIQVPAYQAPTSPPAPQAPPSQ